MGCDGGTIPKRHELCKTKKKPEEKDKDSVRNTKWTTCALTSQPLKEPVVACQLGRLYNKDALIEFLLDKSKKLPKMSHIKGLKSVSTLNLHLNPAWSNKEKKGDAYIDTNVSKYICPVSQTEMSGRYKFCFLLKCCCVLSHKVITEIKSQFCPACSKPYDKKNDVIIINPDKETEKVQEEQMLQRKLASKSNKKKKEKKLGSTSSKSDIQSSLSVANKYSHLKKKMLKRKPEDVETKEHLQTETFKSLFTTHSSAKRSKDQTCVWEVKQLS